MHSIQCIQLLTYHLPSCFPEIFQQIPGYFVGEDQGAESWEGGREVLLSSQGFVLLSVFVNIHASILAGGEWPMHPYLSPKDLSKDLTLSDRNIGSLFSAGGNGRDPVITHQSLSDF